MTARQKRIWDLLAEHECLTSQQIAALLHISDRTVRSDIKEINGEHTSEVIRSKKGQGYFIDAGQPEKNVPASKPQRPEDDLEWAIIRQVLFCRETPYLELAEELFISDTLLSKIVSELNRNITRRHSLPAILKQNGILSLAASEEEKRSYYTLYIMNRNVNHYFDMEQFQPFFDIVDLKELKELMFRELDLLSRHLYDTTIVRLIIDTAVMAERAVCGFFMPETPSVMHETPYGKSSEEGALSTGRHFLEELGSRLFISFPPSEYEYFSRLFQNDFYYVREQPDSQAESLLEKILIEINVEYGFDFTVDKNFCHEMTEQLHGALERRRHRQHVINPVLSTIKSKYPLEYDIAIFFADRFKNLSGISLSEDEISLFAIHFIRAMETNLGRTEQRVGLINPYGKQIKELMVKRLGDMGECRFQIAYTWSVFDYPHEMPKDILAVLTTVPLPVQPADVPVILCRNFLNYHEKEKLLTVVRDSEVNSIRTYFRTLFKPSLFFTDMEFDSRRSAVAFLCGKLREQGYVGPGFLESVMQRESIAPTAFEPGFAFAHAMENNAKRTAVCVCVLKNKLPWGEYNVKIIFLFALAPTWNHTIIPIYNVMIDNLFKTNTIYKLAKIRDCRQFMDLLI